MFTYVIVANASQARILSAKNNTMSLTEISNLIHSASRLREQELVTNRPGSGNNPGGYRGHSMGHEQDAHQRQGALFAHQLSDEIDKLVQGNKPCKIYLIAAPAFLGQLRAALSKPTVSLVVHEITKDLVTHSVEDIRSHLPEYRQH